MKYVVVTETAMSPKMQAVFWRLLHQQGILREEVVVLPLLGSEVPEGSYHKATAAQLRRTMPEFRKALESISARCVIPCGGPAFRAVTGLTWPIATANGYILTPDDCRPVTGKARIQIGEYKRANKAKGIAVGDPKFAMRNVPLPPALPSGCEYIVPATPVETLIKMRFKTVSAFRAAFFNAGRVLSGAPLVDDDFTYSSEVPPPGIDWSGTVAYDLEVPLDSFAIERASLASARGCWSFPWGPDAVRAFKEAMAGADVRVAHNQQFDIPILAAHGIEVPEPQFDTMLAASLIEPDLPKSLASVIPLYLLASPWKHWSGERGFADPEYSAKDAFMERELALALQRRLEQLEMAPLFNERMMPAITVLMDMKDRGIKVSAEAAERWCAELSTELERLGVEWGRRHPTINPHSVHQIKQLLYKDWDLPVQRVKGDGITTNELALKILKNKAPSRADDLDLLLSIRNTKKMLSTFGRTVLGKDRVNPSYLPAGKDIGEGQFGKGMAATGRLSCSRPNLQNQPKEARILYVPDGWDMVFIEFDWSQAELRVAAAMSGDLAMQKALKGDIHATTMELLGCDRTRAKGVIYGSAYGAGPRKLKDLLQQSGVETTERECRELQDKLAKAYPVWWQWRYSVAEEAGARQYLRNPFGRIRRFPMGDQDVPAALDFVPQSVVADMGWSLYRPVYEVCRELGGRLTTVVHDSFLVQVPADRQWDALRWIPRLLESRFDQIAPGFWIPVTAAVGTPGASWGDLKETKL